MFPCKSAWDHTHHGGLKDGAASYPRVTNSYTLLTLSSPRHACTSSERMPPLGDVKACQASESMARTVAPRITPSSKTSTRVFAEAKSAEEPFPLSPIRGHARSLGGFPPSSSSSSSSPFPTTSIPTTTESPLLPWRLKSSRQAARISNPVRNIVDHLKPNPAHPLPCLNFALGDPTAYASQGHLLCPDALVDTVIRHAREGLHNGYTCSAGALDARQALARAFSYEGEGAKRLTADDVIIASGGSGALEIAMAALLNEGDAVLIPRPGFALYRVIAQSLGAVTLPYDLLPEKNWAIDMVALEATIVEYNSSSRGIIKAILINNPSNPCGNIFSLPNLLALLDVARRYCLPIISDEIYGQVCFPGEAFHPLGTLTRDVPVLTIGGLAKQYAVPGWRVGWVLIQDPLGLLEVVEEGGKEEGNEGGGVSVRQGLKNLTQLILGANTLAQSVIPTLFPSTPSHSLETFHANYVHLLAENARFVQEMLLPVVRKERGREGGPIVGVSLPNRPQGTLYMLLKVDARAFGDLDDDVAFCAALLQEENLVLLPGQCFGVPGYVRLVLTPPQPMLAEGLRRLRDFCGRHACAEGIPGGEGEGAVV